MYVHVVKFVDTRSFQKQKKFTRLKHKWSFALFKTWLHFEITKHVKKR